MIANHVILGDRTWDNVFETRRKSRLRGLDIKNNLLQGICLALDKNGLMLSGNCILSKQRTSSSGGNQCQEWCLESSLMSEFVALRVVSFTVRRRRRREEASNWFTLIISWFPFPSFASHDSWQPRDCCRKDERKRDDDKLINHTHIYNHLRLSLREAIIAWSRSCSSVLVSSYQERKKTLKWDEKMSRCLFPQIEEDVESVKPTTGLTLLRVFAKTSSLPRGCSRLYELSSHNSVRASCVRKLKKCRFFASVLIARTSSSSLVSSL